VSEQMNLKRAIVCEKNKEILDEINLALHTAFPDCDLITTDSGNQCIKIAKEKSPDIFILGLDISDMCAFELIRTIRCLSDNYILVLSCTGKDDELLKIMKEGADRYIKKPVCTPELIARIKAL
jgi:two-component system KDP operon response regulator KdpE